MGAFAQTADKGGVDCIDIKKLLLKKKLSPFAKHSTLEYPNTQVVKDGAPAHSCRYNLKVSSFWSIAKLLWPRNFCNLNTNQAHIVLYKAIHEQKRCFYI